MENKIKGAWIMHHGRKIQATTNQDFDGISYAGKCGALLSAISGANQEQITNKQLDALARANNISPKAELPVIIKELERQRLILPGAGAIEVLGLSSSEVLNKTATIFDESEHDSYEDAVVTLSERSSDSPISDTLAIELISDLHHIPKTEALSTLQLGSNIGFFDSEQISSTEKLIFNGNLFRREDARKASTILNALSAQEAESLREVNEKLDSHGCLTLASVKKILTEPVFARLHSIGLFDVSMVGNESGKNYFVTKPAAFSKFTNTIADDALDLAKAFVASLTYGMTVSSYYRGRIQAISLLMEKLINGGTVGPATAIGNDYQALELKGVVKVIPSGGLFKMKLLKPEVGRLALEVIRSGNITEGAVEQLPGAKVTKYVSPEETREVTRKNSTEAVKIKTRNLLNDIRTGGLS
ncbi:hypothetical protein N5J43_01545 [Pseudomonas nicosulfuronedens]|uniref:hypothetical protein n=1 Tax=Pseudomonas nicosulfuronedens TaxID=2571105 RepID=UPI00244AFE3B|nr:hypothetical protein [Pseudomonas nicosulfuronedens]MDH1007568.1 hypothetical protein [Pseudomonas nicosulfuronedens]MDH1977613.1 hypothetical protein [Pseudomonas nicosulfuronedens]MDH2025787.1 hypothetical protein [Pseudomonas nicosulfuronedens]